MSKAKVVDPLAGLSELAGSDEFAMTTGAWEYPSIGYNSVSAQFYIDSEQTDEAEITILAIRRCKEVTDSSGTIWRYHPYVKRHLMKEGGKAKQRLQAVVLYDGKLHLFGANSWTARALFDNKPSGEYHDKGYQAGLEVVMRDFIKRVKFEHNVATDWYCWKISLAIGKPFPNPKNPSQNIHAIVYDGPPFTFVGKEQAAANKALVEAENLKAWADEWHKAGGVEAEDTSGDEPGSIGSQEDKIEDIPGFDL